MNDAQSLIARRCLAAAYDGTMDFPTILGTLQRAGFEGYDVDFRRGMATYHHATDGHVEFALPDGDHTVAPTFLAGQVALAVREAQANAPGYTYAGFCANVRAAGCAGYQVSLLGKRVLYFGRTAETHVEHFPQ